MAIEYIDEPSNRPVSIEYIDPMFRTEEEGRLATKKLEEEKKRLAFEASPVGFAASQIVGGINEAINAATMGGSEAVFNAFGKTSIPMSTAESVKGVGYGVGSLIPIGAASKVGGAIASAAGKTLIGRSAKRAIIGKEGDKFARDIQKEFVGIKRAATKSWENDVNALAEANPDKTISLRSIVDDLISRNADLTPEARNVFKKSPKLSAMLKDPNLADNVSLKDTQEIINYINTKVPPNIRANTLDIVETLSDIRASQLEAFPEMANIRADYAKVAEPWKNIRNNFKFNKTLEAINSDFGGAQGKEAVKALLSEQTIKEMGGYKNAVKAVKAIKAGIGWGITGATLGVGGKAGYELVR